jgi:hypothetical protein
VRWPAGELRTWVRAEDGCGSYRLRCECGNDRALFRRFASRSNQSSSRNSIDHSSDAHDCSGCRDELRNYPEHADQNCHTQEAQTPEKRYPTEPVRSPHRFPTHGWTVTTIDSSRHEACDGRARIGVQINLPFSEISSMYLLGSIAVTRQSGARTNRLIRSIPQRGGSGCPKCSACMKWCYPPV